MNAFTFEKLSHSSSGPVAPSSLSQEAGLVGVGVAPRCTVPHIRHVRCWAGQGGRAREEAGSYLLWGKTGRVCTFDPNEQASESKNLTQIFICCL